MPVDERTFCADVKAWIDEILARRSDLPYGEAKVEEHQVGSQKRLDLKVFYRGSQRVALTGEVNVTRHVKITRIAPSQSYQLG